MPMDFPDMASLKSAAKVHKFRQPHDGELERTYRTLLADHVFNIDPIESEEIRYGIGWDQWNEHQRLAAFMRTTIRGRHV